MQYSIASAISTILLASSLASAAVINNRQANEVRLTVKTGDGDASVGISVTTGSPQLTDANGRKIAGCTASISTPGITCQALNDTIGLNVIFNSKKDGILSDKCDGSTGSQLEDASEVASICCADSLAFPKVCKGAVNVGGTNNNNNNDNDEGNNNVGAGNAAGSQTNPPPATTTTSSAADATETSETLFPVTIQLSGLGEFARQYDILSNGKPQPVQGAVGVQTGAINHTHKRVTCQAFQKANDQFKPIGGTFAVGQEATFDQNGVKVDAVSCKLA